MQNHSAVNPAVEQAVAVAVVPTAQSFNFHKHSVRVVIEEGAEYFIAKDLAPILGFKNARQAVRTHVSVKDRRAVHRLDTLGGNQLHLAVNESGLYALTFGSTKPEAQDFKRWVTSEVLPALRKTGRFEVGYRIPEMLEQVGRMLRGRGAAKGHQLNRLVAHRDGTFSFRVGKRWSRHVASLHADALPPAHSLRQGLALSAFHVAQKAH
jgi:prophage antirepressor-like protein